METPKSPTSVNHRLLEALSRVAMVMRSDDWSRSKAIGLNPTQLAILELLEGRRFGMSVKEIAAQMGVSQPSTTDSVNALERKALIEKRDSGIDRRVVSVAITPDGLAALETGTMSGTVTDRAVDALDAGEQEDLLLVLIRIIRQFQEAGAIPIQRMCATCRHFAPFIHPDAAQPHHCNLVNAAFGQRDLRIDCREHETADPASRAATWNAFQIGSAPPLQTPTP